MYFLTWHNSLFGFHTYHAPRETHLYTRQDSDMSNHNQKIPEVSPSLFYLHCIHLCSGPTFSHLRSNCNSLLTSRSASSTPHSNHNTYHDQVILPKTLVSFY